MKVTFWGSRGSIPVPDSRMIQYGGNTTCVEVSSGDTVLIIDAGTGIRKLGEDLKKRDIADVNLFITHSHWDHIQGLPFFEPIYVPETSISIFGCTSSYRTLREILSNQMSYEYFPISFTELKSRIAFNELCSDDFGIGPFRIRTIRANHPVLTSGLRIEKGNASFVFITDNELLAADAQTHRDRFVEFSRGATYLVHDAQFTEEEYRLRKGWGHSTYDQVEALGRDAGAANIGFFHHDPNRQDEELVEIETQYRDACWRRKDPFNIFAVQEAATIEIEE